MFSFYFKLRFLNLLLHLSIKYGNLLLLKIALFFGADINHNSYFFNIGLLEESNPYFPGRHKTYSAIFLACLYKQEHIIKYLLSYKNVNINNFKTGNPLFYCTSSRDYNLNIIEILLAHSKIIDSGEHNLLVSAILSGDINKVNLILKKNCDINRIHNGYPILYKALFDPFNNEENDECLIAVLPKFNLNLRYVEGYNILESAVINRSSTKIIKYLLSTNIKKKERKLMRFAQKYNKDKIPLLNNYFKCEFTCCYCKSKNKYNKDQQEKDELCNICFDKNYNVKCNICQEGLYCYECINKLC